ncbi:MAG TPA: hypothetical protein VL860_11690 [Planctomycetota bacterium]|nr:hypothetical protein [Planctomycetota bacterium]
MALGDALAGLFGGNNKKRIEKAAKKLQGGLVSDADFDAVVRDLQGAKIPDEEILIGLYENLRSPRLVVKYGLVERAVYFPGLNVTDFLQRWTFGTAPLWRGYVELGNSKMANVIEMVRTSITDENLFRALLTAEARAPEIFEAYFAEKPLHNPTLDQMATLLAWDDDTLWGLIQKKKPALKDAVEFLCDHVPSRAPRIIAMNLTINMMVSELLEKAGDQGVLFAKAITTMNYPLAKFWGYVLANHQNDKIAAIRFIFTRGQNLLKPMLMAVLNEKGTSEAKPTLSDIVTVFAEESPDVDEEETEYLTAESVVEKLGWSDEEIFKGCLSYCKDSLADLCMLFSRHFPQLLKGLVFKKYGLPKIIAELGQKFADKPQRCDQFLKRNKIKPAEALDEIIKSGDPGAVGDFGQRFPNTCGRALADRLPDDPAAAVSLLAAHPWARRSIFLAVVFKLDCEGDYQKAFKFVQEKYVFLNLSDVALGMLDDGNPIDEVLVALFQGTTGNLPELIPIADQMGMNQRDLFRLFARVGDETKTSEVNTLLSELVARQPEFSVGQLISELAVRESMEIKVDPLKLIQRIVQKCPGVLKRSNGFAEMHDAYVAYYSTAFDHLGLVMQEAVGMAAKRDPKVNKTLEELAAIAQASPKPEEDKTIAFAAERTNLDPGLLARLLKGDIQQDLEKIATGDPAKFDRPERTVLRMLSLTHPDLKHLYDISKNVDGHYQIDAVAAMFGTPTKNTAYISIKKKVDKK